MILEISEDLEEILRRIEDTTEVLRDLEDPGKLIVLGVVLSRTIRDLDDEEVDEGEMIRFLMKKSEQILTAIESLQVDKINPKPKVWS